MRTALVTILPMLVAAILVMVGGGRMAREETETRTPTDKERLFAFSEVFQFETERIDTLLLSHLNELSLSAATSNEKAVINSASRLVGVPLVRVFDHNGNGKSIAVEFSADFPEIEVEGHKRPLNPNTALVVDSSLLEQEVGANGTWLKLPDERFRAYCHRPTSGTLVVIPVDFSAVQERLIDHLRKWSMTPLTPLKEADERVRITTGDGMVLSETGPDRHGPASAIIPLRGPTGEWRIMAWDGIVTTTSHDPATLAVATAIALLIASAGPILFLQQRRALKISADRVSFVNRVSHELGTPLTNLSLNLDLATEAMANSPNQARHRLGLAAEEIERLGRLVANVLTFSRRERDNLDLKPVRCDPAEVINRTLESFRPALERRGVKISLCIEATESAFVDPDALSQITGNLISNVEKYASSGRALEVSCRQTDGNLSIEIRDFGPGIPESHRETIFDDFERVHDSVNEGSSGTGLGLSIALDLATRMGGSLELLSPPSGACFRLVVPSPPAMVIVSEENSAA